MKKIISIAFVLIISISFAQKSIQIEYKYEGTNKDTEELLKSPNNLIMNLMYYKTEGNDSIYTFQEVKDLRTEQEMKRRFEAAQPVKSMHVLRFSNERFVVKPLENLYYIVPNQSELIKAKIPDNMNWVITRESKKVLNFEVRKATLDTEEASVTAWYAPVLPFKVGPKIYQGLPGSILELTIVHKNEMESIDHLMAIDVQLSDDFSVSLPKVNKVYSKEEWDKIKEEKRQKFMEMQGQGVKRDE